MPKLGPEFEELINKHGKPEETKQKMDSLDAAFTPAEMAFAWISAVVQAEKAGMISHQAADWLKNKSAQYVSSLAADRVKADVTDEKWSN